MPSWLNCSFLSSLRTRLLLLVLLAVIPALGLILYSASEQRRAAITEAQENTLRLVRLAANNQRQMVEGTRQLLTVLAQMPIIRQGNSPDCHQLLADLLQQYPTYGNLAVIDTQGNIICSGITYSGRVNVTDRSYFKSALQTHKFVVGDYQIGRITKKPTVSFAFPVLNKVDQVQSVVMAALDLDQWNQLAAQVQLPEDAVLSVVNQKGILLVRYPEAEKWLGKSLPQDAFVQMKTTGGEGVCEITGLDGVRRIFAFVPLGDDPFNPDAYISVGVPVAVVLDHANWLLVSNLLGLGTVTILALVAAWVGGNVFLIRQVQSLVRTAQTLGSGQLNARSEIAHTSGELGKLARAIDEMAIALAAREMAIASLNQDMKTLFELIPIGILITQDPEFKQVRANPAFAQILGLEPRTNISDTLLDTFCSSYKLLREGQELPPEEFPLRYAAIHKTEVKGTEVDLVRDDGRIFNLFGYAAPLVDNLDKSRGAVAAFLDITERKQVEEKTRHLLTQIQHQANVLQAILSASVDHIYIFDLLGRYQYVSGGGAAILGLTPEEMVGKTWRELNLPANSLEMLNLLDIEREAVIQTGQPIKAENSYQTPEGLHYYEYILTPLHNPEQLIEGVVAVSRDISGHKQTEQALRESEQRLRLAQRVAKIGTWDWNVQTNQVSWSEGIWDLLGLERGTNKPGFRSWLDFIHPDDRDRTMQAVEAVFTQGEEYYDEYRILRQDGTILWLASKGRVIRNYQGEVERFVGIILDISERKQVEVEREELLQREQAAREAAEVTSRIKDEFLAVLSHELRTPLNPIIGWTNLLRAGKLKPEKAAIALETIERNAKLQTQLVEDLLDISRILQGKFTLNLSHVYFPTIIEAAKETFRLAAEAKSIQIFTEFTPGVSPFLGDAGRLQQVVWNLLSNAVKFTPEGGQVTIKLESTGNYAQLQVSDTGQGISQEFLPYVFEIFRQADSATTRKFGGLGLGLAIARHIVEMHGGRVYAQSLGENQGATFTVKLPQVNRQPNSQQNEILPENLCNLHGVRVLVVDDEADIRDLVVYLIQQSGAEVIATASAIEALQVLKQSPLDILVCDIAMPDMDGYMLMQQVRAWSSEQGGQIPAIALSAYPGEFNQRKAIAAGFQRHLSKPVDPKDLVQAIASLLYKGF
ncbi:PAS domain S-box protein [Anabaena subtropica]|uniref:histidine kinase n=1 Tax=Anabaena subtropica FACHB-260 TaxID=2692884 RepID=A0ABR8CV78_9NOST|nr:PAS domain S-box protein [Anabaena subtropica]MBD2345690.1 PAS domain S-box protein [Anabaena subtropica FACHB-260]